MDNVLRVFQTQITLLKSISPSRFITHQSSDHYSSISSSSPLSPPPRSPRRRLFLIVTASFPSSPASFSDRELPLADNVEQPPATALSSLPTAGALSRVRTAAARRHRCWSSTVEADRNARMSARFDSLDSDGGPGPERCQFLRKGWMYGHGSRFTATIIVCLMVLKIKYVAVVMGASASAEDISREIAKVAKEVHIASRSFKTGSSAKLLGYENVWRHPMVEALSTDGGVNFPNGIVIYADTILHCTGLVSICHRDLACIPAIWDRNLQGVLPPTLVKLPFLKIIDLTRNYLSGTIIPE